MIIEATLRVLKSSTAGPTNSGEVVWALRERDAPLLFFDDVPEGLAVGERIVEWCDEVPDLRVLATSRARLDVPGAKVVRLAPLPTDDCLRLFENVAQHRSSDFVLDDENRPVVEELVERLERLPLAVELAAGLVSVLSPLQIVERLGGGFELLEQSSRRTERTSLQGAIEAAWSTLSPSECRVLEACAVFEGEFSLEAFEALIDELPGELSAIPIAHRLIDRSLVERTSHGESGENPRLRLLEPIRLFAENALAERGNRDRLMGRLTEYYVDGFDIWRRHKFDPPCTEYVRRVERDFENLERVYEWSLHDEPERGAHLACVLAERDNYRREFTVAVRRLERALEGASLQEMPALEAKIRMDRALNRLICGEFRGSDESIRRAIELAQSTDSRQLLCCGHLTAGLIGLVSDSGDARASLQRGRKLAEREGYEFLTIAFRYRLAKAALRLEEYKRAERHLQRALQLLEQWNAPAMTARVRRTYGTLVDRLGEHREARKHYREAISLFDESDHGRTATLAWERLAQVNVQTGNLERAAQQFRRAIQNLRREGKKFGVLGVTIEYGAILGAMGEHLEARRALYDVREQTENEDNRYLGVSTRAAAGVFLAISYGLEGRIREAVDELAPAAERSVCHSVVPLTRRANASPSS